MFFDPKLLPMDAPHKNKERLYVELSELSPTVWGLGGLENVEKVEDFFGFSKTAPKVLFILTQKLCFCRGYKGPYRKLGQGSGNAPKTAPPQKVDFFFFFPIFLAPLKCSDENLSPDQIGSGLGALANAVDRVWISAPVLEI
jgi:hypothetical protein